MNHLQKSLDSLSAFLETEEGKASIKRWGEEIKNKEYIVNNQIKRLFNSGKFEVVLLKTIEKYDSDSYKDRYSKRGEEPREDLFFFLNEYARQYGREATEEEYNTYGNMFTYELLYCNGYFFNTMNGQGTVIQIEKEK